jgi:formylglycine-generating enzyme required for sulfatase activity
MVLTKYILALLMLPIAAFANNVTISNLQLPDNQTIQFDIAWDNAWDWDTVAEPFNHDAVWVFVKVHYPANTWMHGDLSTQTTDYTIGAPLSIETVTDGKGVFIHRNDGLAGNVSTTSVTLKLQNPLPNDVYAIKIFGVEMVYVPEGPYFLGDSTSFDALGRGNDKGPLLINSENAITIGTSSTQLSISNDEPPAGDIAAAFPKGYGGFYSMKHEISQEQYKDFLNCLTLAQQTSRTAIAPTGNAGLLALSSFATNRNGIRIGTSSNGTLPAIYVCDDNTTDAPNSTDDGQNRACNFLSWNDVGAWLDWAALRPMTELEFEKINRGPAYPVNGEFAWGTPLIVDANTLAHDGLPNETVTDAVPMGYGLASHGYLGPQGGLRCGFGGSDTSNRLTIGASYYGATEMSGNLWELVITTTITQGLTYTGATGDGNLDTNGNANTANWPSTDALGAGHRGGAWNSGILPDFRDLAISDRFYIGLVPTNRRNTGGGRGCR